MGYFTNYDIIIKKKITSDGNIPILKSEATMLNIIRKIATITKYDWNCYHSIYFFSTNIIKEIDNEANGNIIKSNKAILREYPINNETIILLESSDSYRWDDWEEDIMLISKEFPNYEFIVEGRGESREDWWIAYFCNGVVKMEYAKIISPWDCFKDDDSKIKETIKEFERWNN